VKQFLLDIVLPRTDRAVFIQWALAVPFWIGVAIAIRRQSKDVKTFAVGLAVLNLAWFAVRTVH